MSGRYVDTTVDRARWRFTANYRLHTRLQLGVEFNAGVSEFNPLVTAFLLTETETRPALFLGTSSDRIGSPEGKQAYYATASKYLPWARSSVNATLNYSEWDNGFNVPFGGSLELGYGFAARYMYDGNRPHALLDYFAGNVGISLIYVWLEEFGIAIHGGF
jgi:hypothetical protein